MARRSEYGVGNFMLGDWVSDRNSFPMKVTGYYSDVVYLDFDGNEGDEWEVDEKDIIPIPITSEILDKNGFENDYWVNKDNLDEFIDLKKAKAGHWVVTINSKMLSGRAFINYVHELQHIICCSNIIKEIKL